MTNLDEFVQQEYRSPAYYLVKVGCQMIKRGLSTAGRKEDYERGFRKIEEAVNLGRKESRPTDLTPLLNLAYEEMRIVNSGTECYDILKRARKLGATLDEERIREHAYNSIINHGAERLQAIARYLEFQFDPDRILEESYRILQKEGHDGSFSPRALSAIAYAVQQGGKVDKTKLPSRESLAETIQEVLKFRGRKKEALNHLENLKAWGIDVASPETIRAIRDMIRAEEAS